MANITITIPDNQVSRVQDAFDNFYKGRPEGTTKNQWVKLMAVRHFKSVLKQWEGKVASDLAVKAKMEEVDALEIT